MSASASLEKTWLFHKIHGALLAGAIGDAMGGPVEGLHYQEIEERFGRVETLLPYQQPPDFHAHFDSRAGAITDDTRLKLLLCQAIIASKGTPRRGDLIRVCAETYYRAGSELEQGFLEEYVLGALYGDDKLCWRGQPTNGFLMANAPLGLICPGDANAAFALSYDLDFISGGYARYTAAMAAAAVAAAMRPHASPSTIIDETLAACQYHRLEGPLTRRWGWYKHIFQINETLVNTTVEIAARHQDVFAVRPEFYAKLQVGPPGSEAAQTLAVALGMMVAAAGDLRQTLIGCVNYGRDNDSYASVAGAIVGALHGVQAIPRAWRRIVEQANPQPDMRQLAAALAGIVLTAQHHRRALVADIDLLLRPPPPANPTHNQQNMLDKEALP